MFEIFMSGNQILREAVMRQICWLNYGQKLALCLIPTFRFRVFIMKV